MASSKRPLDIDPDYELITQPSIKRNKPKEESAASKCERARQIIAREFQVDLADRQKELELIQQRLTKAKKILHLVRYLVVTSYYNDKEVNAPPEEAVIDPSGNSTVPQNRIHPAVKKIIGKSPARLNFKLESRSSQRASSRRKTEAQLENTVDKEGDEDNIRTIIEFKSNPLQEQEEEVASVSSKTNSDNLCYVNDGRERKKQSFRVVIGNISKFMPAGSPEDSSTHKWMVYVRGPKESPDITHIVKKVRFFLHPSYKPHDVVEVREAPFHLSRRGWGEFPLRVQLHFQCSSNKPVDVIHHIKLDRTYTGRQTLGNETIYNLHLYIAEGQQSRSPSWSTPAQETLTSSEESLKNSQEDFKSGGSETTSTFTNSGGGSIEEPVVVKQECIDEIVEEIEEEIAVDEEVEVVEKVGLEEVYSDDLQLDFGSVTIKSEVDEEYDPNQSFSESVTIKTEAVEEDDEDRSFPDVQHDYQSVTVKYEDLEKPSCSRATSSPVEDSFVSAEHDYCHFSVKQEPFPYGIGSRGYQDYDDLEEEEEDVYCQEQTYLTQEHSYSFGLTDEPSISVVEEEIVQDETFTFNSVADSPESCAKDEETNDYQYGITLDDEDADGKCAEDVVEEIVLIDDLNINHQTSNSHKAVPVQSQTNAKMNSILKTIGRKSSRFVYQQIITPNGNILLIKKPRKPQVSLLKKIFQKNLAASTNGGDVLKVKSKHRARNPLSVLKLAKEEEKEKVVEKETTPEIDYQKFRVDFPENRIRNVDDGICFLLRRLPLISDLAVDTNYKCTYPFTAPSEAVFRSWPIGKRLSSEWSRAKEVKKILIAKEVFGSNSVTTKYIINYARSHCFTPCLDELFNKTNQNHAEEDKDPRSQLSFDNFADVISAKTNLRLGGVKAARSNGFVDIIDVDDSIEEVIEVIPTSKKRHRTGNQDRNGDHSETSRPEYEFVRETCGEIGINLALDGEEDDSGKDEDETEKVLLKATLCFAENLIRNAYAAKISNNKETQRDGTLLDISDIYKALLCKKFRILFKPDFQHPLLE